MASAACQVCSRATGIGPVDDDHLDPGREQGRPAAERLGDPGRGRPSPQDRPARRPGREAPPPVVRERVRLGVVRQAADAEDRERVAETHRRASRPPPVDGRWWSVSTPRGIVAKWTPSGGDPPKRSARYATCSPTTERTVASTALDVQIGASCGRNGAVKRSRSRPIAAADASVCVTPQSENPSPPRWRRARARRASGGPGAWISREGGEDAKLSRKSASSTTRSRRRRERLDGCSAQIRLSDSAPPPRATSATSSSQRPWDR